MTGAREPDPSPPTLVVRGAIDATAAAALRAELREIVASGRGEAVVCDVGALQHLDEAALDALVRLQLTARRQGASIALRNASGELIDLLELVGLDDVLGEDER